MQLIPNSSDLESFFRGRPIIPTARDMCGEFLVESAVVDREQLLRALQLQDRSRRRLGDCLARLGYARRQQVEWAIALRNALDELDADARPASRL
jgi:hypothetical protein